MRENFTTKFIQVLLGLLLVAVVLTATFTLESHVPARFLFIHQSLSGLETATAIMCGLWLAVTMGVGTKNRHIDPSAEFMISRSQLTKQLLILWGIVLAFVLGVYVALHLWAMQSIFLMLFCTVYQFWKYRSAC